MTDTDPAQPAQPRKDPPWLWLGAAAAALLAVALAAATIAALNTSPTAQPAAAPTAPAQPEMGRPCSPDGAEGLTRYGTGARCIEGKWRAIPQPTAEPAYEPDVTTRPKPSDFTITIKVLEKQCFGSAGCNITYRIEPRISSLDLLSAGQSYKVVHEVTGGEDGPVVNTFDIDGDEYSYDEEESISTRSSGIKLKAKVTEVLDN